MPDDDYRRRILLAVAIALLMACQALALAYYGPDPVARAMIEQSHSLAARALPLRPLVDASSDPATGRLAATRALTIFVSP